MIGGIVSAAAKQVGDLLVQEARFLGGIQDKLKELQTELEFTQSFLKDADSKRSESDTVRRCLVEIRDIAYDIEDILEFFTLRISSKRKQGCWNTIRRYACIFREGRLIHKVGSQIDKVTNRISQSTRRLQTAGVRQLSDRGEDPCSAYIRNRQEQRRSYPHLVDGNTVGFHEKIEELVSVLTDDQGHHPQVVSICGMGGVGKTTLAKKVYNNHRVRDHGFVGFAWVFVSQQFEKENVWEGILSSLGVISVDHRERIFRRRDPQELAERLHTYLTENKCLVVLDDIWSTQAWDILQPGFPTHQHTRSRIVLTSRNTEVALHTASYLHALECLDDDHSWELFLKIAFPNHTSNTSGGNAGLIRDHARMEELGKKMIKHCAGLPLAITVLGGILATKDGSYHEWQMVHDDVKSYIRGGKGYKVQDMLSLSYESLPSYLKPCFLYFANFPEDYEIPVAKLIHTWVAEGFVQHVAEDGRETMEDVAEGYLIELFQRCMIQVGKKDEMSSKILTCRMHDLMRDVCLFQAKQENFVFFIDMFHKDSFAASINSARRLATVDMQAYVWITRTKNPRLRSFFYFYGFGWPQRYDLFPGRYFTQKAAHYIEKHDQRMDTCRDFLVWVFFSFALMRIVKQSTAHFFKHYRKLRVLDAENMTLAGSKALNKISHLIHLRYLCLADANVQKLPSSLGKLACLQTLDLRVDHDGDFQIHVPDVLTRMKQLRHLYLPEKCSRKTKIRLVNLRKLQTLVNFPTKNCAVEDLSTLTNLRELRMIGASASTNLDKASKCINCVLNACCCGMELAPDDDDTYVGLEEDPMPILEMLPNLRILALEKGAFVGNYLSFSLGGFPLLESLILTCLPELVELRVEEGAMPTLHHFHHLRCMKLTVVPQRLSSLITGCSSLEFGRACTSSQGRQNQANK